MNLNSGLFVLLLALVCLTAASLALPQQQQQNEKTVSSEKAPSKGGLLDFANYKKLFNKSYSNKLEEAVRLKYFMSGALQVAASALGFRFRTKDYYLAVNEMTDWTPEEFEMMENKAFAKWAKSVEQDRGQHQQPPVATPKSVTDERVAQEKMHELLEAHKGDPVYDQLDELLGELGEQGSTEDKHARRKRATGESAALPPRELPLEMLIKSGDDEDELSPQAKAKLRPLAPSNNPKLKPVELSTQGITKDELEPVLWHSIEANDRALYDLGEMLEDIKVEEVKRKIVDSKLVEKERRRLMRNNARDDQPDRVFVDLRETGCIAEVRHQRRCGSCYAFAMTSIMEYLYCKSTGKLVPMSEQYIIDCGKDVMFDGCSGGSPMFVPQFISNFGLYPRALYPYQTREEECPYDASVDFEQTGYFRSDDFSKSVMISKEFWGNALNYGPLMVGVVSRFKHYFRSYGGGVITENCEGVSTHAVVLVGHGRQDGREYWLIRNSWGPKWGEGGYAKIDKESTCIEPGIGFAFGVTNPKQFGKLTFVENELNQPRAGSKLRT